MPPAPIQELRDLTRTRKQLVREVSQHMLRIQKVLEDVKVGSVLSNILGRSGRAILEAVIAGEQDPERLAQLAQGTARKKHQQLVEALHGRITPHHRAMLKLHLDVIAALEAALRDVDAAVGRALEPIRARAQLLTTMPGISDIAAQVIVAEIGVDMSRFPMPGHLVSWAGLCPRNDESAGKRRSTRVRKSSQWLKTTLVTCAWAAVRTKDTYLRAQFLRIKSRRGAKKASSPSRPRCSPPSSTCCATASSTATSVPPISTGTTRLRPSTAWLSVCGTSAAPWKFRCRPDRLERAS